MKIYLISSENEAKQISQLLKLNTECAKLHWSKTIADIPPNIISSLETLESFIEERVYAMCNEKTIVGSLSDDEESAMMTLLRNTPELRETLGIGIIMAGTESEKVVNLLDETAVSEALLTALKSGKNVVLF